MERLDITQQEKPSLTSRSTRGALYVTELIRKQVRLVHGLKIMIILEW